MLNIHFIDILGVLASVLSASLFLPQLYHMVKVKSGSSVSYIFLALQIVAAFVWIAYGYFIHSLPLIVCDACILIITTGMFAVKYKFA